MHMAHAMLTITTHDQRKTLEKLRPRRADASQVRGPEAQAEGGRRVITQVTKGRKCTMQSPFFIVPYQQPYGIKFAHE